MPGPETELAWAAGLFDGEGNIRRKARRYHLQVEAALWPYLGSVKKQQAKGALFAGS